MARSTAIWLSLAVLCAGAGCTTHVTAVRPLSPEKEAEINQLIAGREAKLTVTGGAHDGKDVRLAGSTLR